MFSLLEKIQNDVMLAPDERVLADDTIPEGITREKLWNISGKVYAYLSQKGIGCEDFVLIKLPRGIAPIIAQIGVWRAGAAFVIIEDTNAVERVEYIKNDCNCKLVIDVELWSQIQYLEPKDGYVLADPHDAAYAVYTSGSTGEAKGALHEYGNIERGCLSLCIDGKPVTKESDRFALISSLNFVAAVILSSYGLYAHMFLYVVPYETTKNLLKLEEFIIKNRITGTFFTPSFIKMMDRKAPLIQFCLMGSESANGIYLDGVTLHNFYAMSESGYCIAHFFIDQKYEETPVGKSPIGQKIYLLDEDGNEVTDGKGEICFENKYFRGYIGLKDEAKRVLKNGLFHTGNLGKLDEKGNLIVCGRIGNMVKINGNRVEPNEIEKAAIKALGLSSAACRIIEQGDNHVSICIYYTDKVTIDAVKAQEDMRTYLPSYMIPSHFMHLDKYPTLSSGKLDRSSLPIPDFSEYTRKYVAPSTELQKILCKGFESVLNISKVGIQDDFFDLGGDSLRSIELVTGSGLKELSVTDIFEGRTIEEIAKLYTKKLGAIGHEDPGTIEEIEKEKIHPLCYEQLYMADYQFYTPSSTMYNLYQMIKLDKSIINLEALAAAINLTVRNHTSLLTTIFYDDGGSFMQKYSPEKFTDIIVEQVSEAELATIKETLVQPFTILDSLLFHIRLFETDAAGYLFMDAHHIIFDGTSHKTFFSNVFRAYEKQEIIPDYYYYTLYQREKNALTDAYIESRDYFENTYSKKNWTRHISPDYSDKSRNSMGETIQFLGLTKDQLLDMEERYGLTINGFFITVTMIATAIYERKNSIFSSWIYNGRNTSYELNTIGLLYKELPIGIEFSPKLSIRDLYRDVTSQIYKGILHSAYPYVYAASSAKDNDYACIIYQDDIRDLLDFSGFEGRIELENAYLTYQNIMDIEILNDKAQGLMLMLSYNADLYKESSIEKFIKLMTATTHNLLALANQEGCTMEELFAKITKDTTY